MSRSRRPPGSARLKRHAGMLGLGVVAGAVTGLAGTAVHLQVGAASVAWPVGMLLAVGLIVAVDVLLAISTRSAVAMIGDATGRAVVLALAIAPGPGGDMLLMGVWSSEVWSLVAVLLPALAAPLLSTWAAADRVRASRRAVSAPTPRDTSG